ncbi:MAG TPA: hypothetical protein VG847_07410 [Chitinophagaceae bacterium]|nr:hypothetical protein [Chitinophagaceae bacterium]
MKTYLIAIIAVIGGAVASAFTMHKPHIPVKRTISGPWYYEYNLNTVSGEHTPSNYTFIDPQPDDPNDVEGCEGTGIPCVILATGTSGVSGVPDASEVDAMHLSANTKVSKSAQ